MGALRGRRVASAQRLTAEKLRPVIKLWLSALESPTPRWAWPELRRRPSSEVPA